MFLSKLSVKIKLSLLFSLIISLSCATIGWVFFHYSKDALTENFMKRGRLLAENLADNSWYGIFSGNNTDLDHLIESTLRIEEVVHGAILNREKTILSHQSRLTFPEDKAEWRVVSAGSNAAETFPVYRVLSRDGTKIFIFLAPVTSIASNEIRSSFPQELLEGDNIAHTSFEGNSEGTVRIGMSDTVLDRQIEDALHKGIFVTLLMIAGGMTLGYFLARSYSHSLSVLAFSAKKISGGDFFQEIPVRNNDEIGNLTLIFNQMARSLLSRDQEMKALHQGLQNMNIALEQRVRERTSDLEEALQEVISEKNKTEEILHQIADGVIVTNMKKDILLINGAARRMLQEIIEEKKAAFTLEDIPEFQSILNNSSKGSGGTIEIDVQQGGAPMTLKITVAPLKSEKDEIFGSVAVMHDVTRFKEVDRLKSEFVAHVSHEIRTPLTSIRGYIDNLLDGIVGEIPTPQREYLNRMDKNAERLIHLINDLLDLSRIESGNMHINLKPLSLDLLIKEVTHEMEPLALLKGVDVRLQSIHNHGEILGDWEKLIEVVTNLLMNAIKFTPSGGKITVSLAKKEDQLITAIQDNGIGISEADLPYIFDRFYSIENEDIHVQGGTGLGLFIAKKLIKLQEGELWVQSKIKQGTTFFFSLPIRK